MSVNAGDTRSIPGSGRFPGEGNGNFLLAWETLLVVKYSGLGNSTDRGAW